MSDERSPADELADACPSCLDHELEIAKLSDQLRGTRASNRQLLAEVTRHRDVEKRLEDLPKVKRRRYPKKAKTSKGDCAAIVALSDWHYGQLFDASAVEGRNSFNPEIAAARATLLPQKIASMYGFSLGFFDLDELIVCLLGDFIHGHIHEENLVANSMEPMEELVAVRDHLISIIEYLHATIAPKRMRVIGTRGGNHARTTKRTYHTKGGTTNLEWMLYSMVSKAVSVPVEWELSADYFNTIDVKGQLVRVHHGDNIRYWGGVGGVTIPLNKSIAAWNKLRPVTLDLIGHYHQFKRQRDAVINASLVGYDPFALSIKADYEPPGQGFLVVDREKGLVFAEPVFVE